MCHKKLGLLGVFFFFLSILFLTLEVCAQTAEDYYNEGNKFYESGNYDKAIENYEKAITKTPKLIGVFNNLANVYLHQKRDYKQAEQICLEGLSYYPFEDSFVLIRMYIDFNLGRIDKGISKYIALSQQNLSYTVTFPVDKFEKIMGDKGSTKEDIIQTYRNLLHINPKDYVLLYNVAEYLKDNGQYQEALDLYKKVIELDPHKEVAYVGLGTCYYNLGNAKLALDYFKKAKTAGQYVPEIFFEKLEEIPGTQ